MKRKLLFVAGLFMIIGVSISNLASAQLIINVPTTFQSLDGGGNDADGLSNGTFTYNGNLTLANGGSITNNDLGASANSAGDITMVIAGFLDLQGTSGIFAENLTGAGNGGNITISIGTNFTMAASTTISSSKIGGSGGTGEAKNILINVQGPVSVAIGAVIKANSPGPAGDVTIHGQRNITISGTVQSLSTLSGTGGQQGQGGGVVWIDTECNIFITPTGVVSSRGGDPGADLVHLKGCLVSVFGLVESTAAGHVTPFIATSVMPPFRPDKDPNSTAGIEIWANTIIIDRTNGRNGEVKADLTVGASKRSWIDLFANLSITILGPGSGPNFAVHANVGGNNGKGGNITIKSFGVSGSGGIINLSGNSVQANATGSGFRNGGNILAEANSNIVATGTLLEVRGIDLGGVNSFKSYNGSLTVDNTTTIQLQNNGTGNLSSCIGPIGSPNYIDPGTTTSTPGVCGPGPGFVPGQDYVILPPASCITRQNCDQNIILPVLFGSFTAKRINNSVLLKWTTLTEINNRGFEVQRRAKNSNDFQTLAFVNSLALAGNSSQSLDYTYTDGNSFDEVSYYRIKQIDQDGKFRLSEIRIVDGLKDKDAMLVYPNPALNADITVIFGSDDTRDIQLSDMSGKIIQSWRAYKSSQLKLINLEQGTYIIRATNTGTNKTQARKIVVTN